MYHRLLLLHQAGLLVYAERRSVTKRHSCYVNGQISALRSGDTDSMGFIETSGAFILYGAGIVLSSLAFLVEVTFAKWECKRPQRIATALGSKLEEVEEQDNPESVNDSTLPIRLEGQD